MENMGKILERFSCANWLLINESKVDEFINQFKLKLLAKCNSWKETQKISTEKKPVNAATILFYNIDKLIISSSIKGYRIIEGKSIYYLYDEFCKYLSRNAEVYRFYIDIWIPAMLFEYYKNEHLVRHCEYKIDDDKALAMSAKGEKLKFEDEELELPHPEYGYDIFYYPLSIMNYLGISNEDILNSLNDNHSVYILDNDFVNAIKRNQ